MLPIDAPFTSGDWHVKAGNEQEFLEAWKSLAECSMGPSGGREFILIRDVVDPLHFVSFGWWSDPAWVTMSRSREEFVRRFRRVQALCEQSRGGDFRVAIAVQEDEG